MSTPAQLRTTIASFFEVPENQIGPTFSLRERSTSMARAALDAAIRHRVGRTARSVYSATTYGEIESELFPGIANGDAPPSITPPASEAPQIAISTISHDASCGIDIELIADLPPADDYWESPFYRMHFAPAEIADCLRRETPTIHLAARWCVKEALKKCDPAFLTEEMSRIELTADDAGRPYLLHYVNGTAKRLPHAVSLSHTSHAAVAVVVQVEAPAPVAAPPTPALPPAPPAQSKRMLVFLTFLLSLAALILAAIAFFRTIPSAE